ncbi:MAG: 16S rRNA (cytidine(1402)-2'-O)-methyltransferase [Microgenomates group bacterium]|jgi:16S rRNA (cytidine1402-2'-O)-methyltransferase
MLTIVSTPIGNLKDITLRALEALKSCDAVICEDSRHTGLLLHHFEIKKPMVVLNDNNEFKMFPVVINRLQNGKNLCLVSDAGTPLVSDPGYKLIRECLAQDITVDSLPGPTAAIVALTLSGLPPDKFMFLGYLPEKQGKRTELLKKLLNINELISTTFITYVAPHKLIRTLEDMQTIYGSDFEIVLEKELTKLHQNVKKQKISEWLEDFKKQQPKGEFTLLLGFNS